jgi:predicted transcriptional regulator
MVEVKSFNVKLPAELKDSMDSLEEVNWSAVTRNLLEEKVNEILVQRKFNRGLRDLKENKVYTHEEVMNQIENEKKRLKLDTRSK